PAVGNRVVLRQSPEIDGDTRFPHRRIEFSNGARSLRIRAAKFRTLCGRGRLAGQPSWIGSLGRFPTLHAESVQPVDMRAWGQADRQTNLPPGPRISSAPNNRVQI